VRPNRQDGQEQQPRWVSLETAAEHLDCHTRTLRRMVARGEVTGVRLGPRLLRVDLNEIEAQLRVIPHA
jgi:excisionase family DNA binding protein